MMALTGQECQKGKKKKKKNFFTLPLIGVTNYKKNMFSLLLC